MQSRASEWQRHELAVDVWLTVRAKDRAGAWRKARRALSRLDRLDPDVGFADAQHRPVQPTAGAQRPERNPYADSVSNRQVADQFGGVRVQSLG